MLKQSHAWNKHSNYYFLSAEIAALALLARNDIIWKFWLRLYVLKPLRDSVWVKGNALIVAGVQGTQPKVSPPPFCPAFGAPPKAGILCFLKQQIGLLVSLARNDGGVGRVRSQ